MKNLYILLLMLFCLSANAAEIQSIDYKNIKDNAKITFVEGNWKDKVNKKSDGYFVKKSSPVNLCCSEYYSKSGDFLFSTGTQYEFIYKGSLIGYSNSDLKFYEFSMQNDNLMKRELTESEIQEIFPKYKIIKISDFRETNSFKVKKKNKDLKIILLNDTDRIFDNYCFTTNNSKLKIYELAGFLSIKKKGMVQYSRFGENTKAYPWFVILVR